MEEINAKTVTKSDLIRRMSEMSNGEFSMTTIRKMMNLLEGATYSLLEEKNKKIVIMQGLSICTSYKEPREARNPMTGETFTVPARYVVKAATSKYLKDYLKNQEDN